MTIRAQTTGTTAVLSVAGSIGGRDFSEIHHRLVDLLQRRRKRIVLDFEGVEHVSYRDASQLARDFELVRSHDGDLRVAGLSPYVRAILTFAGLSGDLERNAFDPGLVEGPEPVHEPHAS
jgi:anti-sigma B factor antagonist